MWTDPDFNPYENAFYDARVQEDPAYRKSYYEAKAAEIENPNGLPDTIRTRAWLRPCGTT